MEARRTVGAGHGCAGTGMTDEEVEAAGDRMTKQAIGIAEHPNVSDEDKVAILRRARTFLHATGHNTDEIDAAIKKGGW